MATMKAAAVAAPATSAALFLFLRRNLASSNSSFPAPRSVFLPPRVAPLVARSVSPLNGFDKVKMAYKRRRKDAESSRDAEYFVKLDRAYDTVMMEQVQNRKKGVAYGSIQVAKDIKYADHQPIVPWGPRWQRTSNMLIINQ